MKTIRFLLSVKARVGMCMYVHVHVCVSSKINVRVSQCLSCLVQPHSSPQEMDGEGDPKLGRS